jgi:glycerophosphoryl diester phosphodiesterase
VRLHRPAGSYWKVAHRGASAFAPENSLAALDAALAMRVDFVELDVVGAGGALRLGHSHSELRPDSPSLDEALALFTTEALPEARLDLDVKTSGIERALLEALATHDLLERTLVTSFGWRILRKIRDLEPKISTGISYPNDRLGLSGTRMLAPLVGPGLAILQRALPFRIGILLRRAKADAAMLHHALVSPEVATRCHASGAAVFAWTVETRDDLRCVVAAGADGVIANDPSLFDQ